MALLPIIVTIMSVILSPTKAEMSLGNITRLVTGDLFSIAGRDCSPTRCVEWSSGTAVQTLHCQCRCPLDTPAYREDRRLCVTNLDECVMASFGRGASPQIPFVFLPQKGQIIYPANEIVFTDVSEAICAVTSAQYLTPGGWVTLRDGANDVPFTLYRDEGSTFLQWRGSAMLHSRLEGRLVAVHVLCSTTANTHVAASCAAFRVAGSTQNALLDVRSIPFHAGEVIDSGQGLSVLESLAIGVCALMLIFIYAAGIIFYVHYKQKQKKQKDPEHNMSNCSESGTVDSRIDMNMMKTNPLMKLGGDDFLHDNGFSDNSDHTEGTQDSLYENNNKTHNHHNHKKANASVVSAVVHSRKVKRPAGKAVRETNFNKCNGNERFHRRSTSPDTFERAPQSDLSIVDCSVENHTATNRSISSGEPIVRRKLYFNPVFFETEHLKNPPPAAVEFLEKIREVMSIAKDKMTSKRFIPMLSDIPEEDYYHSVELGWDFPCARRGRRYSAISLKHENSRKMGHCSGCPGCDTQNKLNKLALIRSNSCKTCMNEDYKQKIVRKWLDEVPTPLAVKPVKSVAKVSGTPRVIEPKSKEQLRSKSPEPINIETKKKPSKCNESTPRKTPKELQRPAKLDSNYKKPTIDSVPIENPKLLIESVTKIEKSKLYNNEEETSKITKNPSKYAVRKVRKKLPPPPPPPPPFKLSDDHEKEEPILPEVKVKMEAVIRELHDCHRVEPMELEDIKLETLSPMIAPKLVIPVIAEDSLYYNDIMLSKGDVLLQHDNAIEFDSLERNATKRRRFSLACGPELPHRDEFEGHKSFMGRKRLATSWLDMNKAFDDENDAQLESRSQAVSEIVIGISEPIYDNVAKPGPLTIEVRGSPVESRRNDPAEDFDPDTLDRKPKRDVKKRVEKILLKSAGSFKYKSPPPQNELNLNFSDGLFKNQIGNLRHIYENKTHAQEDNPFNKRRGSLQYEGKDLAEFLKGLKTPDLIQHLDTLDKPPVPPTFRHGSDLSPEFGLSPGERRRGSEERFGGYSKVDLNARRSGRRSARTRARRTDMRKTHRTEDSGYMSTDSNESKRRAKYLLQLRPKIIPDLNPRNVSKPPTVIESDTDEIESLCDGRSESGAESVETDSVFFGHVEDSKELLAELGVHGFENRSEMSNEQIDSGFMGETNIILSGDSDSEHRSVISIMTGSTPEGSMKRNEAPYKHTIEC